MSLRMKVGFGSGDFVLDGDPARPEKGAQTPSFSGHVYCGKTAGWIKNQDATWHCTKVGPGPGDIVLDGDPAPSPIGAQFTNFRPISVVA